MGRRSAYIPSVVLSVALLSGCGGGSSRASFTFGPSITSSELGASVVTRLASTYGHVSPVLARRAERIAASDATLAQLVRTGSGQRAGSISPWFVGTDRQGGAVLEYKLERRIAVNSDLPYVVITPDAPAHGTCVSPYAPGWAHLRASGVTQLSALVDLRRKSVVDIGTNARRGRV